MELKQESSYVPFQKQNQLFTFIKNGNPHTISPTQILLIRKLPATKSNPYIEGK